MNTTKKKLKELNTLKTKLLALDGVFLGMTDFTTLNDIPFPNLTHLTHDVDPFWGKITQHQFLTPPTWKELLLTCDRLCVESGDYHHIYQEGFTDHYGKELVDPKTVENLRTITGS